MQVSERTVDMSLEEIIFLVAPLKVACKWAEGLRRENVRVSFIFLFRVMVYRIRLEFGIRT